MNHISLVKKNDIFLEYNVSNLNYSDISCLDINNTLDCNDKSNLSSCLTKEVCKNIDYYNQLKELQMNHSSANGRYYDTSNLYQLYLQKLFNLGIGIIGASTIIFIFS